MTSIRLDRTSAATDDAFTQFYGAEHDLQVRRAYLMLGDGAAAHDVVAAAFVVMYQRWHTIERPGPYLNRCVLNGCRDAGRKAARETTSAGPLRDHGESDHIDHLGDVLAGLPFRQRAAIVLRFYGGCSENEIADYLGCKPGTVGSLIHRGLRALRSNLEPEASS